MSIDELENLRKKVKNIIVGGFIASIVISLILFIITNSIVVLFIAFIVGMIISFIASISPNRKFTLAFKNEFVLKSLKSVFDDVVYTPEKGMDESVIRDTQMMDMGNVYSSNDLIIAKYKDVGVIQADVHIQKETDEIDDQGRLVKEWETLFKGRWMVFDFNKNFKANLQVCQKGFDNAKLNNWNSTKRFNRVMMEDQVFNDMFRVYAQSDHEAFYILTPSLMERIKKLVSNIRGKILFCFVDNKLHVGIENNRDSFEHVIFIKIDEKQVINSISKDIKLITSFVDELNLDNDLFRKEV